jgi:hypothetical protein
MSQYLGTTTSSLPSWTTAPDAPDDATKLTVRDDLTNRIKHEQSDPCVIEALTFAADDFFTSSEAAHLARSTDIVSVDGKELDERALFSCRKCRKFIDKVIGAILSLPVLTSAVCTEVPGGMSVVTTPFAVLIAGYVCVDAAERGKEALGGQG